MKGCLPIEISTIPSEELGQNFSKMLDALADALADQFIAKAKREVAERLGVDEESLSARPDLINIRKIIGVL